MTTPETPASVDGGPELYDIVDAVFEEAEGLEANAKEVRALGGADMEQEARARELAAVYLREHAILAKNRRPTPRDAALRAEGRVQGLLAAARACEALLEQFPGTMRADGMSMCMREVRALAAHPRPSPDASQGSAPPGEDASCWPEERPRPLPELAYDAGEYDAAIVAPRLAAARNFGMAGDTWAMRYAVDVAGLRAELQEHQASQVSEHLRAHGMGQEDGLRKALTETPERIEKVARALWARNWRWVEVDGKPVDVGGEFPGMDSIGGEAMAGDARFVLTALRESAAKEQPVTDAKEPR